MITQNFSLGRLIFAAACILCAAPGANAAVFAQNGVRAKSITVCFVGDAVTSQAARVQQIKSYLVDYGYAANIQFNYLGACPARATQANGNDYYDGDIRVVLPGTSAAFTGMVPGKGCPMFLNAKGVYDGTNDGPGSWSNFPGDLAGKRSCLYNMKLNSDGDTSGVPWRNHTLHEFGHALGLAHEHSRSDVDATTCSASWAYWLSNTSSWPKTSLVLGSQTYSQTELINLLKLQPAIEDASVNLARPLIAAKLSASNGTNSSSVNSAIGLADTALKAFTGKLPYAVSKTSSTGSTMTNLVAQLDTGYGGSTSLGLMTPYDRNSVMHYQFTACGINGNYANTGLLSLDRLAAHILYPEDAYQAEYVGTTVIPSPQFVSLQSAWAARGANMNSVASNFRWTVNGILQSTAPALFTFVPLGDNTFTLTHTDLIGRTYTYQGTIKVLTAGDYNQYVAALNTAASSLM